MIRTNYKHPVLDAIRWVLILAGWIGVTLWLWQKEWYWGALWVVPGFFFALNVFGFAMMPVYMGLNGRRAERELLDELRSKRESQDSN